MQDLNFITSFELNKCWPVLCLLYYSFLHLQKEYARYKQAKGWKHLVVYKSGIHALGLYTSRFISRGAMVRSFP